MKKQSVLAPELIRVPGEYREVLRSLKQQTHVPYAEIIRQALAVYLPTVMPGLGGLGLVEKEQQTE